MRRRPNRKLEKGQFEPDSKIPEPGKGRDDSEGLHLGPVVAAVGILRADSCSGDTSRDTRRTKWGEGSGEEAL